MAHMVRRCWGDWREVEEARELDGAAGKVMASVVEQRSRDKKPELYELFVIMPIRYKM